MLLIGCGKNIVAQPLVNVLYFSIDMLAHNLSAVVDGLLLHVEQYAHIAVGCPDDSQNGKLHIRLRELGILAPQAADGTV